MPRLSLDARNGHHLYHTSVHTRARPSLSDLCTPQQTLQNHHTFSDVENHCLSVNTWLSRLAMPECDPEHSRLVFLDNVVQTAREIGGWLSVGNPLFLPLCAARVCIAGGSLTACLRTSTRRALPKARLASVSRVTTLTDLTDARQMTV